MYGLIKISKTIVVIQLYDEKTTRISYRGNYKGFLKWKEKTIDTYNYILSGEMHWCQKIMYERSLSSINKLNL